jgi:hypothetical protein
VNQKSVQLGVPKYVQGTDLIQGRTRYIRSDEVGQLAEQTWDSEKRGISQSDLVQKFNIPKSHARRTLKEQKKKILFTLPEKPTSPQTYYPESRHADVIEYFKSESVPVRVSEVEVQSIADAQSSPYQIRQAKEEQEARACSFLEALLLLPKTPMCIHKVFLKLWISPSLYDDVDGIPRSGNAQKVHSIPIGPANVTYTISRNGRVQIAIECSEHPFPMASDEDEAAFFVYLGKVQSNLQQLLSDPHERHTPPVVTWYLKRCDVNWDVTVTDKAQVSLPDIQLSYASRVFRAYVKNLGSQAVQRFEEALEEKAKTPILEAITNLRNPNEQLEAKVDRLTALVEKLLSSKGAPA